MKFGVREICDVVFRAKAPMQVGNKIFYKDEPVMYFDTLKTSTLEGAATTVYAQGGRGNARLMSWDGERTVTFTMEDALISPEGLSILTGAGLIEASATKPIYVHTTERISIGGTNGATATTTAGKVTISDIPLTNVPVWSDDHSGAAVYVMLLDKDDNLIAEPFSSISTGTTGKVNSKASDTDGKHIQVSESTELSALKLSNGDYPTKLDGYKLLVDYYVKKEGNTTQINITPDKFGGAFYIEASTLFREYPSQRDLPAEFIIPNGRVQSNFTFSMAGSGDPSTFTFTVDAFPDYTRFDDTEKVLASIQVIGGSGVAGSVDKRDQTISTYEVVNNEVVSKDPAAAAAMPVTTY